MMNTPTMPAMRTMTLSLQVLRSLPADVAPERALVKFGGQLAYTLFPTYGVELFEPNFDAALVQTGDISIEFVYAGDDDATEHTALVFQKAAPPDGKVVVDRLEEIFAAA